MYLYRADPKFANISSYKDSKITWIINLVKLVCIPILSIIHTYM